MNHLSIFSALLGASALLFGGQAGAATILNGGFESVQIGSPFFSTDPTKIPDWTHAGSTGDALLWNVGYSDSHGVAHSGEGNQFVTMGGGIQRRTGYVVMVDDNHWAERGQLIQLKFPYRERAQST